MASNEEAYPDPRLDDLLRASGQVWPRSDEQLDAWLAGQELAPDEEQWLRDVVRRRMNEAAGAAEPVGTPVSEPSSDAPAKSAPTVTAAPPRQRTPRRLRSEDLALLNEQLLELVRAGVSLPAGLQTYADELRAGRLDPVLTKLRTDLESGLPLSEAMANQGDALPPLYKALVAAGEAGGDLTTSLSLLHEQAEVDSELDRRVRESLAYPGVTFFCALAGIVGVLSWLLPQFREIFFNMGVRLPAVTRALLFGGGLVDDNPVAATLVGACLFGFCWKVLPRVLPQLVRRAAGLGTGSARAVGELSRALAGFAGRGLSLTAALEALRGAKIDLPAGTLARVQGRLEEGSTLADALRPEDAFDPTYVWLIGAAEHRGDLPAVLEALARRSERDYRTRLRFVEAVVGPVAMLAIGVIVAVSVLAIFLPIFEMQRALQQ